MIIAAVFFVRLNRRQNKMKRQAASLVMNEREAF
jgi:hypothetical protein